jgi:hypothetical protein
MSALRCRRGVRQYAEPPPSRSSRCSSAAASGVCAGCATAFLATGGMAEIGDGRHHRRVDRRAGYAARCAFHTGGIAARHHARLRASSRSSRPGTGGAGMLTDVAARSTSRSLIGPHQDHRDADRARRERRLPDPKGQLPARARLFVKKGERRATPSTGSLQPADLRQATSTELYPSTRRRSTSRRASRSTTSTSS